MDLDRLERAARACGAGRWREALRRAAYAGLPYERAGLPPALAARLEEEAPRLSVRPASTAAAGDAVKALLRLADGRSIESVLLKPSARRWTACVSSQAGCALGCGFCATGMPGLSRSLTAEEIADQVLFWRGELARRGEKGPRNVVFMGMGEPLANYEAVASALRALTDPRRYALAPARVAVSTVGLAPELERFAEELPGFPLAVSLHSARDEVRDRLVPVNRRYPLARLAVALGAYLARSPRKLMVEYVLLRGVNESASDAQALTAYLRSLGPAARLHVNLIDYNPTAGPYRAADEGRAAAFHAALRRAGFAAVRRRSRGREVAGACGQLTSSSGR